MTATTFTYHRRRKMFSGDAYYITTVQLHGLPGMSAGEREVTVEREDFRGGWIVHLGFSAYRGKTRDDAVTAYLIDATRGYIIDQAAARTSAVCWRAFRVEV